MANTTVTNVGASETTLDFHALNAMLNLYDDNRQIQFDKDKEAARRYFIDHVNKKTVFFHSLEEKLNYLVTEGYYEEEFLNQYTPEFIKERYKQAYAYKFRFPTFLGAYKYYSSYTLKTFDGENYLERYEDRIVANALYLANGNEERATFLVDELMSGRYQPATPTFLNAGKKARGELVSCFLLDTGDSMESISRIHNASLQLSKRGGGVAINLSNLREQGAPIKRIENQSSGVIPVMKMLEDAFSYANQLGARQGAGAVYLNAHHPDILNFLDTRRENADEKIRIKTLSIGVVIPDVTFKLARENEEMYLFSPYDVERIYGKPFSYVNITEEYENMVNNPEIRKKKINARRFFSTIAEVQIQSGYPYVMFEDAVNRGNPLDGRVVMSNLCVTGDTEILTDAGYRNVKELYETQEEFDVIVDTRARDMELANNGLSVEKSTRMHLTATDADILKLTTSDGFTLRATPWHKMYVVKCGSEEFVKISLQEVQPGDRLLVARGEVSGRVDGGESVIRPLHSTKEDGFTTVLSIEHDGVEDVYDVTVENGNSVIFNGIATGNCTEILQTSEPSEYNEDLSYSHVGKDISCNLGSLNIAKVMEGKNIGRTVEEAVRALTVVSEKSNIRSVPSIERGNDMSRAIGLGQMNLHGYLASQEIFYGNEEGLDFTNVYFSIINYASLRASNKLAIEKGDTFEGFETSTYADGSYFERYIERPVTPRTDKVAGLFEDIHVPTSEDWIELRDSVMKHGLYNAYRLAVAPTGSISYISHSTSSIHPITSEVEIRREGSIGRVYYPAYGLTNQNREYYEDAYEIGWKRLIDTYAVASRHTDQGLSLTLFFNEGTTTREVNRAQMYAWKKGIKTLYYIRTKQMAIAGTDMEDCVSCAI